MKGERPRSQTGDPVLSLASAILLRAIHEARRGSGEALSWLQGDGRFYLEALGMDLTPEELLNRVFGTQYKIVIRVFAPMAT